jgi:small-conductance mechanosensitive channel
MDRLIDASAWRELFAGAVSHLGANVAAFLPNLVGALVILAVGFALARGLEIVAQRALRALGLDRAALRLRLGETLSRAGVGLGASEIAGRLVFWFAMLTFLLSAVDTLGLDAVSATVERLVAYVPQLIGAGLVAVLGLLFARFVGSTLASAAAAAGLAGAARLGFLGQLGVAALVVVVALEQLGVATEVLVGPLSALLAAAGLAAGLAFALGARPVITHILAGHFLKQSLPRDAFVEIAGRRGVVERVGATDTVLRDGERSFSVPNGQLLEQVVVR